LKGESDSIHLSILLELKEESLGEE